MERTIKALVVDDEPVARRVLREELEQLPGVDVAGEAEDGEQALRQISDLQPDLVFLDLHMPAMDGFEVVRNLRGAPLPVIVVVTAFEQHAIEAFEAGAVDYLLKPVRAARLQKAVERARTLLGRPLEIARAAERIASLSGESDAPPQPRKVIGRIQREYFLLDTGEVLAFQAEGELVWILTPTRRYLATQTLRGLEERLPATMFLRVHRNAIVNVAHVRKMSSLSSNRWLLTLTGEQKFVVSKRQAHNVKVLLQH